MTSVPNGAEPSAPRIAIDLDGVLTENPAPLAHAANARFGVSLPERAFVDSAGLNVAMEVREWVYSEEGPANSLQPAPGAQDFLHDAIRVFGEGNALIITARPESSAGMTIEWLKRHGFPVCNVIFADDKMTIARRQGCGYAVEDSERHARNYAAGGITCFLIDPTNQSAVADEPAILPVVGFDAILVALRERRDLSGRREQVRRGLPPLESITTRRPRVVISDTVHPVARDELAMEAELIDVDGTDVPALVASLADADALVVRSETQVTEAVLAAAPKLKVVARAGAGFDNIDIAAATRAGVLVLYAPGANAVSAAEHTISLLLAITRQIPYANASTHDGRWERKRIKPVDLRGRTLGIVGLGRVGSAVATRLRAFEMRVIAYDPYIPPSRFAELGVEPVTLDDLIAQSNVVTFHVPSTEETHHMLDSATLTQMKPDAIVINAARGEVVDQGALATSLREGRIAAAGVDVFPHEPCTESPLFGLPNAVLTPHTGGSSAEALEAVGRVISSTTLAALRGESVPNAVNLPASSLDAPELRRLTTVAGAAGLLLSVLSPDLPDRVRLTIRGMAPGDVSEHVLGAGLSAALQRWLGRRVTPVNARVVAEEIGLGVSRIATEQRDDVQPQFLLETAGEESHTVTVSWDRVSAGIVAVDRFSLERPLAGHVLITHHHDQPGVIGQLGTILGQHGVNIAGMQVGRHAPRGEALMVTNVDEEIPADALAAIKACTAVEDAYVVSLPSAEQETDGALSTLGATALVGER